MATVASTGQIHTLADAQTGLLDIKGNQIQFKEQKDGSFTSEPIEGDSYNYQYALYPHSQPLVTVQVTKTPKEQKQEKASAEEKKAIQDAETVAEFAPDKKTKKEAETVAAIGSRNR